MTIGAIVHYRIGGPPTAPVLRPAIVVCVDPHDTTHGTTLQVFLDQYDEPGRLSQLSYSWDEFSREELARGMAWRSSRREGDGVGEWRWPARADGAAP